jgi:hypothetical protein
MAAMGHSGMATIPASLEFLQWQESYEHQKPYEVFLPQASFENSAKKIPRSNLVFETQTVQVHDASGQEELFSLDKQGFQFVKCPTSARNLKDRSVVNENYVPEMEAFLQCHLGGESQIRVHCFDLRVSTRKTHAKASHFHTLPNVSSLTYFIKA